MLVCTTGDADKEVFPGFANIARVECIGFFDPLDVTEIFLNYLMNTFDFSEPATGAGPCDYSATRSQNGHVFDESRVRIFFIRRQAYEFKSARFERFAIRLMLTKYDFEIGFSQIDRS